MFGSLLGIFMSLAFAVSTTTDPFADLSPGEIKETIRIIRDSKKLSPDIRFPVIRRQEPPKKDWLGHRTANFRQAYAAVFDYQKSLMTEVIVDLNSGKLVSTKDLPGIKPPVLVEEYERARKLVRIDLRWQKAMRDRGVQNLEDVWIDIWAPGLIRPEEKAPGQRLLRCLSYMKGKGKNFYSRPIEGVVVTVDLSQNKVTSVWDMEKAPIASGIREIEGKSGADLLKPLTVIQKKGSSVQMSGQDVTWYRWKFHWSMDPMQGLQLHHVRFDDKGVERTILYKISLAEMFVPYGAPEKSWSFRNAFDVGEYGVGKTLHPLEKGKDVPDNAILLDVHVPDDIGKDVLTIPGAALFERDMGVSWKHRDSETGEQSSDQARQLVATFMTTVGNYDYGVTYIFHMDGTLQVEAQLTGIMLAKGTELVENSCLKSCQPLAEKNILAPFHQHFFNFRMDFDVDGINNNAVEMNVKAVPMGKANPDGNAFVVDNKILKSEKKATGDLNMPSARKWKVVNYNSKNALGHPRSFAIMPGENSVPFLNPKNQMRTRARFVEHPIWFTVFNDDEMSGAHPYPTTAPAEQGLPHYIANDESLENKDVVLWYTFGITHIPRPEEWPIMTVHKAGFTLMPVNFFGENPAL